MSTLKRSIILNATHLELRKNPFIFHPAETIKYAKSDHYELLRCTTYKTSRYFSVVLYIVQHFWPGRDVVKLNSGSTLGSTEFKYIPFLKEMSVLIWNAGLRVKSEPIGYK